jgi:hypothetical protein
MALADATGRPFHKFKMLKMKKVGRDQGMKLTMLWCSHIAIPLISRNVAFQSRHGRQSATPYQYVVEFVFGNRSRLIWINRSGRDEGSLRTIGLNERSQRAFARKAGVNVSKTLRGMVLPSEKILRALKLQVVYLSK